MIQLNLRIGNKLLGKKLITGLVPLLRRYNEARKSLRGSISQQSRQGLDWMNFFLADVQTAFGAFVAFYLADLGWPKGQVGLALGIGTLAGAAGNALTAGLMGLAGQYFAKSAIFFGAAALCIPALIALSRVRADEIDYARARNAGKGQQAETYHRIFDLGKNRNLYTFAACVFLFQI